MLYTLAFYFIEIGSKFAEILNSEARLRHSFTPSCLQAFSLIFVARGSSPGITRIACTVLCAVVRGTPSVQVRLGIFFVGQLHFFSRSHCPSSGRPNSFWQMQKLSCDGSHGPRVRLVSEASFLQEIFRLLEFARKWRARIPHSLFCPTFHPRCSCVTVTRAAGRGILEVPRPYRYLDLLSMRLSGRLVTRVRSVIPVFCFLGHVCISP